MKAIILATGMGKRLKNLTQNNTKCMVKVNGVTLIERMLTQLDSLSLTDIVIVIGYQGQNLVDFIKTLSVKTPITFINNPIYDKTNNIYSLSLAKKYLVEEDSLLLESDIIFENSVLECLVSDPRPTLALVDKYESWMDGSCVKLNENDEITEFIPGKKFDYLNSSDCFKTVNIYKFSKEFSRDYYVPFLEAYQKALGQNEYYEQVLKVITMLDNPQIKGKRLSGQKWYEIDDIQDLDIASSIFQENEEKKLSIISKRFGGFWRYPSYIDYCYLVNPYFPSQRMKDELKANFDTLLSQYPSGMAVNSLIAGRNFNVNAENIVVGNGAAELIKALVENLEGKIGIIRPTFEEYGHRTKEENLVVFESKDDMFRYNEDDLIHFFDENEISNLVLINPDNPSGNYITKAGLLKLIEWTKKKNITFIVDESFADFSKEAETLIDQNLIDENKHLFVMKSISKSYGVPGIRLGVLVSENVEVISRIKKDVAIWNINSFGEYFMQIFEKYQGEYRKALELFRIERERFAMELSKIKGIKVFPSEANFLMVEIINGISAKVLSTKMLDSNFVIKDLTGKIKSNRQFIRLAIRNREENTKLLTALTNVMREKA